MMVEQRAIRMWSPPKPTWEPLPFVGPPLPVTVRPQSSFTFAKKNVYMAVGLFVLAFGLTTLLLLLRH